uniref:Uncharacterized protein n=1 Tax=Caenorhabditis tropicalis TaxID=1561998 RepID=A0A1I7TK73_9PELO
MDKTRATKKSAPSLRAKKNQQRSSSRPSTNSKNTNSQKQKKEANQNSRRGTVNLRSVMVMDREPMTDVDKPKKKEEKKKEVKKPVEVEKKVEKVPEEPPKEEPKKATVESMNIEVIPDKNPPKMDDGYEDFGPGAA